MKRDVNMRYVGSFMKKGSDQKNIIPNKTQLEKLVEMVEKISDRVCKIEKNGK